MSERIEDKSQKLADVQNTNAELDAKIASVERKLHR